MSKPLTTQQRLERLVMRVAYPPLDGMGAVVTVGTARHLLELEHRRLRAKVRKLRNGAVASKFLHIEEAVGYKIACDDILKELSR